MRRSSLFSCTAAMYGLFGLVALLLMTVPASSAAAAETLQATTGRETCVQFEDLKLYSRYGVGDHFTSSGADFTVEAFQWSDGTTYSGGYVWVDDGGLAGGTGQELGVNNARVQVDFGRPLEGLSLRFGEYGGNLNIRINGDFVNFDNFADIDGATIGGVKVSVTNGFGNDQGTLTLYGRFDDFAIGGQELWIDDICPRSGCIDFEEHELHEAYKVGQSFTSSGVDLHVRPFKSLDGELLYGHVQIENGGMAGGSGQELAIHNSLLRFDYGRPLEGLSLLFGEYGGDLNLLINGEFRQFENFADIDGEVIGGVEVSVTNGFGNDQGALTLWGPVEEFGVGGQELWIDHVCPLTRCVEFEDQQYGHEYVVGDTFTSTRATFKVEEFEWSDGTIYTGGSVRIDNRGLAGGTGHELAVNNARVQVDFGRSIGGLSLLFGEYGGNLNIRINGDFRNFDNFADIDGTMIGGVQATVTGGFGNDQGTLTLRGTITDFAVGGQELWIDRICPLTECVDFEDRVRGRTYRVGDRFTSMGVLFTVEPFEFSSGTTYYDGRARIEDGGLAGSTGQELAVNNTRVQIDFRQPLEGLSLLFGEYGGNLNIRINGDFVNFDNFADIDGATIGGVRVLVVNGLGNDQGSLTLYGPVKDFAVGGQELWIDHICPLTECVEYEDQPLGSQYWVGDTFTSTGAMFTVEPFRWADGTITNNGYVRIDNGGLAGGTGHELAVNNARVHADFGRSIGGLTLLFGEYGGNLNIRINGDFRNFDNFADIDGTMIGGVKVSVTNGFGNDQGTLTLRGTIDDFAVGGQELWIDHVCAK